MSVNLVAGLMSDLPGKNCQTIAGHAGHATPGRLQHLLARAVWDAGDVRRAEQELTGLGDQQLPTRGEPHRVAVLGLA